MPAKDMCFRSDMKEQNYDNTRTTSATRRWTAHFKIIINTSRKAIQK